MSGMRRGATSVLKWFSGLFAVLIVLQVYLAGEGIFGLSNIKHDCSKSTSHCIANTTTLNAHRGLGFILTGPLALLFLIVALLAWHRVKSVRIVSIVVPILTFLQTIIVHLGRFAAALHPINAILVLGLFGWLFFRLRAETAPEGAPAVD